MGCSPSVLLDHIHGDGVTSNPDKRITKKTSLPYFKKETNRSVVHRKSSLALTPEDEPFDAYRGPHEVKYGLLLPPNRSPLKVLLVFLHSDPVSEAISKAADKLGFDVTFCSSYDGALEEFLSKLHDLVIIDTRAVAKSLDYDTLCSFGRYREHPYRLLSASSLSRVGNIFTGSANNRCIPELVTSDLPITGAREVVQPPRRSPAPLKRVGVYFG